MAGGEQRTPEQQDEQYGGHDRNTESTETAEPFTDNNQTDRYPTQSDPGTETGREPVVRESSPSEVELDRPGGRISILRDRDGNIIPPNRETGQGMPEFPDSRRRENDPAIQESDTGDPLTTPDEQDLNEKGRGRWDQFERIKSGLDAARKVTAGADDFKKKPKPTGHSEVKTPTSIHPPHHPVGNPTDVITNGVIAGVAFIGGVREIYRGIKKRNGAARENH